jgi:hypothetical protein
MKPKGCNTLGKVDTAPNETVVLVFFVGPPFAVSSSPFSVTTAFFLFLVATIDGFQLL